MASASASKQSSAASSFPTSIEEFGEDERISFSTQDQTWILEDEDGLEYRFDDIHSRWIAPLDPDLVAQQQQAYVGKYADEDDSQQPNKRQKVSNDDEDDEAPAAKKPKPAKPKKEARPAVNTAVYVTSLPLDVTVEEVYDEFKKFGVIAEEVDSGKPRIKLYTDESGKFKGDALIVYFKPESIKLAIQMLDETDFRLGEEGPAGRMRVTEADRSYKKQQDRPKEGGEGGEAKKRGPSKDQKKIMKTTQRLNDKLADWSDDDTAALTQTSDRFDKVVILKNMFTLKELEEDEGPEVILDIKAEIREECEKLGEVTNVQLFDKEQEGVCTVRFSNSEAARACVRKLDGRIFDGVAVKAYISDGTEKFKKSSAKKAAFEEDDDDDETKRLEKFSKDLEEGKI